MALSANVYQTAPTMYNTLMDEQKPGDVIGPGAQQPPQSVESQPSQSVASEAPSLQQDTTQEMPAEPQQFYGEVDVPEMPSAEPVAGTETTAELRWQAQEGGAGHEKSGSWFMVIALGCIVLAGGAYFLTRDIVSAAAILFGAIALLYFTVRKPTLQDYAIAQDGVYVGQKLYVYENFKGFSVSDEDGQAVVSFTPLKRFMPPLIIHVDAQIADQVVDTLATFLPHEDKKPDAVDALMRRLRF